MSAVTAKVVVGTRVDATWSSGGNATEVAQLSFTADYGGDAYEANKEWAAATPVINLNMTVKRAIADEHFPLGRKLTLTFDD